MKKFPRQKTQDEIRAACRAAGFEIDTRRYDRGSDFVTIYGTFAGKDRTVIYASHDGRFLVQDEEGQVRSERSADLDGTDWYDAIMAFLYVAAEPAMAG